MSSFIRGNPYEPTAETPPRRSQLIGDRIIFAGELVSGDYSKLIRVPMIIHVMRVFAVVTLLPFLILPIGIVILDPAEVGRTIPIVAMVLVLSAIFVFADRYISRDRRARRLLAKHPELIGPLRGELDGQGITFFHEGAGEFHQITWTAFPEVVVNDNGIRLDWRNEDEAFIAIPKRCIDDFDSTAIRNLVNHFRREATDPPIYQSVTDWSNCPKDAIRFRTLVPILAPTKRRSSNLGIILGLGAIACAVLFYMDVDWLLVLLIVGLVSTGVYHYSKYAKSRSPGLAWRTWGWLTRIGFEWRVPGAVHTFEWSDAFDIEIDETHLSARFPDQSEFLLTPSDLLDDCWPKLIDWIECSQTSTNRANESSDQTEAL